jgi:glycosyltransferase involved in cell wall biosynthesis
MISIIIPTYNRARTISQAIESVLAQTYSDWELLIIDDGSTDETETAVRPHLADQRVRYVKQENAGPIAARNNGAQLAAGDWLAFLDSDDAWLPEKLAKQWAQAQQAGQPVLVYGNYYRINETGARLGEFFGQKTVPHAGWVSADLLKDNFVTTSTVLLPKSVFIQAGGFDAKLGLVIGEDYELWLRLSTKLEFRYVSDPIALYRTHEVQLTKQKLKVYQSMVKLYFNVFVNIKKYQPMTRWLVWRSFLSRLARR